MVAPENCPSQADYIKYFDDAIAVMQTEAALERIAVSYTHLTLPTIYSV